MIIRILLIVLVFGGAYYFFNLIVSSLSANRCSNCDGQGYWQGTRGEKNFCKACNGRGKMQ